MPFEPVSAESVSDAVQRQVEALILRGVLRPGERLPSERDMAQRLNVSRPSLREALAALEKAGLIETRPNTGARVAQVFGSIFTEPLLALFSTHEEALFDFLTFRREIEGLAADRAAREGSDADLSVIDATFQRMEAAHSKRSPEQESSLDVDFHMSIVEAAHNVVMLHVMRSMLEMLRAGVFYNRQLLFQVKSIRDELLEQHRAINIAIQAREPAAAQAAVVAHLHFIETALHQQFRQGRNEAIAQQRLELDKLR